MPFPFDKYPWLNFQELNLAYFIKHFREIFEQWDTLLHEMYDWKDATDAELAEWKSTVETGISSWETGLRQSMDDWKDETEADISAWEAATLAALDAWKIATTAVFEQIRTEAAASAQAAAESATSAQTALAGAQAAQAAAETAAAGIQSELTQIQTNTSDISELKTEKQDAFINLGFTENDKNIGSISGRYIAHEDDAATIHYPCLPGQVVKWHGQSFWYNNQPEISCVAFYDEDNVFMQDYAIKQIDGSSATTNQEGDIVAIVPEGAKFVAGSAHVVSLHEPYMHVYCVNDYIKEIPTIAEDTADLKIRVSEVENDVYAFVASTVSATSEGWRLNESNGYSSQNENYKILKYAVTEGNTVKIVSDDRFQFQNSPNVPSSGISYRIGDTYGAGTFILAVPEGATYLIVSTPLNSNAEVYDRVSANERIDALSNAVDVIEPELASMHTYYPIIARNGSWGNAGNVNVITIGRFNIPEKAYEISLETDRPTDGTNGYYRLGYVFLNTPVGSPYYTTAGVISQKSYEVSPVYGFRDRIKVPSGAKTVVFTIAQYNSDNSAEPLRKNAFDGYRIRLIDYTDNESKINKKIDNARHLRDANYTPTLTLLHFSDLHKDTGALKRILTQAKNLHNISDIICTGDMVEDTYENAETFSSWWDENVLTCMGNHETATRTGNVYDWTALSMANRDAYYIAPFESNWNIVHTNGTSYYYKDYAEQKVRMIVMDVMLYSTGAVEAEATAQNTWLAGLLADTLDSNSSAHNYHVLIAIHAPHGGANAKECSFSKYGQTTRQTDPYCDTPQSVIDIVGNAITNGVKFIGYLIGHTHQDNIWDVENNRKQLMYCVTCANVLDPAQWIISDQYRDNKNDAYNIVTIDTINTLIKIIRGGGADMDDHMRPRRMICIDYSTGTVVGEEK